MLIAHYTLKSDLASGRSAQHALQAGLFQKRAHPAALIIDQEHLCNRGIDKQYFADNTVGGHHGHVALDSGILPFIDVHDARKIAAAGANHLRRNRPRDELFFERQQGLQAPGLGSVLAQTHLFKPHLLNLFLELAIFGSYAAQIEVVVPEIAAAALPPN